MEADAGGHNEQEMESKQKEGEQDNNGEEELEEMEMGEEEMEQAQEVTNENGSNISFILLPFSTLSSPLPFVSL